jgi:hypothetical protein
MTTTRKRFPNAPVRILVLNAERTALVPVEFRADIEGRLERGIYGIPDSWKASVTHEGRSYIVTRPSGETEWFAADVLPLADEED